MEIRSNSKKWNAVEHIKTYSMQEWVIINDNKSKDLRIRWLNCTSIAKEGLTIHQ